VIQTPFWGISGIRPSDFQNEKRIFEICTRNEQEDEVKIIEADSNCRGSAIEKHDVTKKKWALFVAFR